MIVIFHRKRLEPSLPYVPGGTVMPMVSLHMGRKQPLHPTAGITIVMGPQEEMEMVRHQAVTEQINGYALASLGHRLDKSIVVGWLVKEGLPTVAPVQSVIPHPTD
jgi:hypothetical protein